MNPVSHPPLTGANLVAGAERRPPGAATYTSVDPRTGAAGEVAFHEATAAEVREAATAAAAALALTHGWAPARTVALLEEVAGRLEAAAPAIVPTASRETGLDTGRLTGELARTVAQLRMFAALVDSGDHLEAVVDPPDAGRVPPRTDMRRMLVALGPVAVFGASNFPLAFGVAGGDTASALAAGCPVVAKAHPAHPETSELCGRAIAQAVAAAGFPAGWFSLVHGRGAEVGGLLATEPAIAAVGFTGSLRAGRALFDLAAARPRPIPVYAEMGSVNPLLVTPAALHERGDAIADGLAASLQMGAGQFCTSPGLLLIPAGAAGDAFVARLAAALRAGAPGCLLTAGIRDALVQQLARTRALPGVEVLVEGGAPEGVDGAVLDATLLTAPATVVAAAPDLLEEHFGPAALAVRYDGEAERDAVLDAVEGALTFTIHAGEREGEALVALQWRMAERVGRILWNGYPTGVAVTAAMQHGGPYPATTASLHTSVGTTAIRRFQRPVAFQDAPQETLPEALRDGNPLGLRRLEDGVYADGSSGTMSRPSATIGRPPSA
ncbi:MAG: NADP-dependent aldehyde dehydrogenase [Baekduia sp.]|nr:NADP-dependent aldehyde dehydrogenase [Baekduia sp.]